jgi:alpha-tubulin suppressor-like RCC1 family protein
MSRIRFLHTCGAALLLAVAAAPSLAAPVPLRGIADVGTGQSFSCALSSRGAVYCWGTNEDGNVGNSSYINAPLATPVYGLGIGSATRIGVGGVLACAILPDTTVKCWGNGTNGEMGSGTVDRHTPIAIPGLSGVVQIVAGNVHICALTNTGGVKCWGANSDAQLGDGTTTSRSTPADVQGMTSGVAAITAGFRHTCALTTAGGVKCWGRNNYGQMGNNGPSSTLYRTPIDVPGLTSGVAMVDADVSDTVCALTTTGGVKCWGLNSFGQVGDGTTGNNRFTPVNVVGLGSGVLSITSRCAILAPSRSLKCWGANASGQLGDGTTTASNVPVSVIGFGSDTLIARGASSHRCGVTLQGRLQCWGANANGQLGDGSNTSHAVAADVLIDGEPVFRGGFELPAVP